MLDQANLIEFIARVALTATRDRLPSAPNRRDGEMAFDDALDEAKLEFDKWYIDATGVLDAELLRLVRDEFGWLVSDHWAEEREGP